MMKSIFLIAALALAAPAFAQDKPAAAPEASKPASQPEKQASAKPRKPNPKRGEDARHCLEKPTSTEVIKCAEEYL
jgi:hypothetical protein